MAPMAPGANVGAPQPQSVNVSDASTGNRRPRRRPRRQPLTDAAPLTSLFTFLDNAPLPPPPTSPPPRTSCPSAQPPGGADSSARPRCSPKAVRKRYLGGPQAQASGAGSGFGRRLGRWAEARALGAGSGFGRTAGAARLAGEEVVGVPRVGGAEVDGERQRRRRGVRARVEHPEAPRRVDPAPPVLGVSVKWLQVLGVS